MTHENQDKRELVRTTIELVVMRLERMAENIEKLRAHLPDELDFKVSMSLGDIATDCTGLARNFETLSGAMVDIETMTRTEVQVRRRERPKDPEVIDYTMKLVPKDMPDLLIVYTPEGRERHFNPHTIGGRLDEHGREVVLGVEGNELKTVLLRNVG